MQRPVWGGASLTNLCREYDCPLWVGSSLWDNHDFVNLNVA
jgi:hypothetical protein